MKRLLLILSIAAGLTITGCGSDDSGHTHGKDGDHTHEAPAQQSTTDDSGTVRIGSGDHSADQDSIHTHEEDAHSHGDEEHSH